MEFRVSGLNIACHHTFVGVFLKDPKINKPSPLGRTEIVYELNPEYTKKINFNDDNHDKEQQQIIFVVYKSTNGETTFINDNMLGSATFEISELIDKNSMFVLLYAHS